MDRTRAASPTTVTITCLNDGLAHDVTDVQLAVGTDRAGCFVAICGHLVVAGSLVEPDGRRCRLCTEVFVLNRPQHPERRRQTGRGVV
jgi:hypothetical protein